MDDRLRAMLDFERQTWRYLGLKEDAIRRDFGMSPTRFAQILVAAKSDPQAWEYAPTVMRRIAGTRRR